jgi:hypothetical protein
MLKQKQIAQEFKVSEGYISHIKSCHKFTTNRYLAMEIARFSGKAPIEHITPDMREVFIRAFPELSRKMK